jgi:hypothetical protein
LLRHKKRSTVYKKVQGLRRKTTRLISFLCPWRTRSSGRPGRVAGPATGWPMGSIELGKRERSQRGSRWRAHRRRGREGAVGIWPAVELRARRRRRRWLGYTDGSAAWPLIGRDAEESRARTPRRPAAARRPGPGQLGQMGLGGPGGWAGANLGRAFGLGPVR